MVACTTVRFESPQPAGSLLLNEFPLEMQGFYITEENDTLEVSSCEFHFKNGEEMFISGNLNSEETVLKKFGNIYVLSLKDEKVWDVFPLKTRKSKLIAYYVSTGRNVEALMEDLKKTSTVQEISDTDEELGYYLIDPSVQEFEKLWTKNLFSEKLEFKRMAKK